MIFSDLLIVVESFIEFSFLAGILPVISQTATRPLTLPRGRPWVCQINLGQAGKTKRESELRCHRHGFPFRHRLVAEYSECATGNEVTVDVEQIVNGTVS